MNNLICELCEADLQGCEHHPIETPSREDVFNDMVHQMCEMIKKMEAMTERMNHFEAWFSNHSDRIGTMEKRQEGFAQKLEIWINGRGGMS